MCYPDGGTVDDLIIYKLADAKYLLVVNASNIEKDFDWMQQALKGEVAIQNVSEDIALLAVQGPHAQSILQKLTDTDLATIGAFQFAAAVELAGVKDVLVSRTGYTGEDGFELYVAAEHVAQLWERLLQQAIKPCGLGSRDTLRLEARLALYGQELTKDITPLEAGIGFAVKMKKQSDFIGKSVLVAQREQGLQRKLVAIEVTGRGIPRTGYKVVADGQEIGVVTSGTQSPTLKKSIGLALVSAQHAEIGTKLHVEIRNKLIEAVVVKAPFYKRSK